MPSGKLAGLMAAAIVSDTVLFKSPTSTARDRSMAERMAHIAGISLEELGREIFSASAPEDQPVQQLLFADFKEFHIAGHNFGVSQITCVDSERHLRRKGEFLSLMEQTKADHGYSMLLLMLTDVLLEGSKILLEPGKAVCIRKNQRHAVKALKNFEYIEIHVGTSVGNEDINRITFEWDEIELSHIL